MVGAPLIGTFAEGGDSESGHKSGNKAKRVRTTFTEEQLSVLQANFQLDSNPDGQDLERIAHVTGLSKRVTQVWFQNSRARQKKHLHTGKMKGQHGTSCVCFFHRYLSKWKTILVDIFFFLPILHRIHFILFLFHLKHIWTIIIYKIRFSSFLSLLYDDIFILYIIFLEQLLLYI